MRHIYRHHLTRPVPQVREAEGRQGSRTRLGHYCRRPPPPIATSPHNNILEVNFVSDMSVAMNGFRLEWIVNGECWKEIQEKFVYIDFCMYKILNCKKEYLS